VLVCLVLDRYSKNAHVSNVMNIRPMVGKLFHADEQIRKDEAVAFRSYRISRPIRRTVTFSLEILEKRIMKVF